MRSIPKALVFKFCREQNLGKIPEGEAQTRLQMRGLGTLYYYCNRHGLYKKGR